MDIVHDRRSRNNRAADVEHIMRRLAEDDRLTSTEQRTVCFVLHRMMRGDAFVTLDELKAALNVSAYTVRTCVRQLVRLRYLARLSATPRTLARGPRPGRPPYVYALDTTQTTGEPTA